MGRPAWVWGSVGVGKSGDVRSVGVDRGVVWGKVWVVEVKFVVWREWV